jgi:transposase
MAWRKLTTQQWDAIRGRPPQPGVSPRGGRPRVDDRRCFEGTPWILLTGAHWSELPPSASVGSRPPHTSGRWAADGSRRWLGGRVDLPGVRARHSNFQQTWPTGRKRQRTLAALVEFWAALARAARGLPRTPSPVGPTNVQGREAEQPIRGQFDASVKLPSQPAEGSA